MWLNVQQNTIEMIVKQNIGSGKGLMGMNMTSQWS